MFRFVLICLYFLQGSSYVNKMLMPAFVLAYVFFPSFVCVLLKCEVIWVSVSATLMVCEYFESFSFRAGKNWGGDSGSPVLLFSHLPVSSSGNTFFSYTSSAVCNSGLVLTVCYLGYFSRVTLQLPAFFLAFKKFFLW